MISGSGATAGPPADLALTTGVDREVRRAMIATAGDTLGLNGIDRIEVLSNLPGSPAHVPDAPRQRTLLVWLVRGPVPADLRAANVVVLGGVRVDPRVNPVRVSWAYPADHLVDPQITDADRRLVEGAVADTAERRRVLVVRTSSSGDWSSYVLKLIGSHGAAVPAGFDPPLAQDTFSFTTDCPSDLDCREPPPSVIDETASPVLDYLARDYDALRSRLLDRLATLLPDWTDRSPADPVVTLVELFAAIGDRLASWQDAVAAEGYLGTARRRTSVRRHARLLDYRMHEGCSARAWLAFHTPAKVTLKAGTAVTDLPPDQLPRTPTTASEAVQQVVQAGGSVFETCVQATLRPARNQLWLHSWGAPEHTLPAGSTSAFAAYTADDPEFHAGDVLILALVGPRGSPDTSDPSRRHAVRLVRDPVRHRDQLATPPLEVLELQWACADALPWSLAVAMRAEDGSARPLAVALGNVVLADHGGTIAAEPLVPPLVPSTGIYRPRLRCTDLMWTHPADPNAPSATAALSPDPRRATPTLTLDDVLRHWEPRPDLLASDRQAPHVVVETEPDGTSRLRFGDGVTGRRPDPGTIPRASYRVGDMSAGNVAADVLTTLLASAADLKIDDRTRACLRVTNPLAARGGTDPEPLAKARELAPHAFRAQQRAVTSADYAAVAMRHPAVQRAAARRHWTGSWYAQEIAIDATAEHMRDTTVLAEVAEDLRLRRMAGVDIALVAPVTVPLEIVMRVHLSRGYLRTDAARLLAETFSAGTRPDGSRGFFHPDNFTFGQPLLLSDVVATAMGIAGVDWVEVGDDATGLRFRRMGRPAAGEAARGQVDTAAREVLRADSDPSCPENGRVDFQLRGGS